MSPCVQFMTSLIHADGWCLAILRNLIWNLFSTHSWPIGFHFGRFLMSGRDMLLKVSLVIWRQLGRLGRHRLFLCASAHTIARNQFPLFTDHFTALYLQHHLCQAHKYLWIYNGWISIMAGATAFCEHKRKCQHVPLSAKAIRDPLCGITGNIIKVKDKLNTPLAASFYSSLKQMSHRGWNVSKQEAGF